MFQVRFLHRGEIPPSLHRPACCEEMLQDWGGGVVLLSLCAARLSAGALLMTPRPSCAAVLHRHARDGRLREELRGLDAVGHLQALRPHADQGAGQSSGLLQPQLPLRSRLRQVLQRPFTSLLALRLFNIRCVTFGFI